MGEYTTVSIYKPLKKVTPLSPKFDQFTWNLYNAGQDREKIEALYRSVNFVHPNGRIVDLYMRFIERDGQVYQTNRGIPGIEVLPDLSFDYKFDFHDFWLSIFKPSELQMDENEYIVAEISGKELHNRFKEMLLKNKENPNFLSSRIYKHYSFDTSHLPCIKNKVLHSDIVTVTVGHIYEQKDVDYRTAARKSITEDRKKIANQFYIPHWQKSLTSKK